MSDDEDINNDEAIDFEDEVGFEDDSGFDDFSNSGTLGDLWRNNPMVKIGTIMAAVAVIAFAIFLFGGGKKRPDPTALRAAPEANDFNAQESEVSQVYKEAVEARNEERAEIALKESGSALPLTVDPARGRIAPEIEEEPEEDPLERWRKLQEQRMRQRPERQPRQRVIAPEEPEIDTRAQAVTAMSQAMATQMEGILGARKIPQMQIEQITPIEFVQDLQDKKEEKLKKEQEAAARLAAQQEEQAQVILLPAGEIEYGQLIVEANSDTPGPILAQIVSGPLRNSKILGSFSTENDYLILKFNQIVIDGISYRTNAVALDPATANVGMATEVDHRYFTRVVLPAAASFVQGLASAVAESESTTVSIDGSTTTSTEEDLDLNQEVARGVEELGSQVGDTLDEIASSTKPLIRVAAGTPLGILFVDPVIQE